MMTGCWWKPSAPAKRRTVSWKTDLSETRLWNCFGRAWFETGQRRVPAPPHMMTGWIAMPVVYPVFCFSAGLTHNSAARFERKSATSAPCGKRQFWRAGDVESRISRFRPVASQDVSCGPDFCLIFTLRISYDETEILPKQFGRFVSRSQAGNTGTFGNTFQSFLRRRSGKRCVRNCTSDPDRRRSPGHLK